MVIKSNIVDISVTSSSGCNCPAGEVCANSDGSCPANSFPDNYNPGCCIPCSQLIPQSIILNSIQPINAYYIVTLENNGSGGLSGTVTPSCSTCLNNCKTNEQNAIQYINVTGKLVDSAGHGICNQNISAVVNNDGYAELSITYPTGPFGASADATWWILIGNAGAVTDSNGNFTLQLPFNIGVSYAQMSISSFPGCHLSSPLINTITFAVTVSLSGANVQNIGTFQINLQTAVNLPG